jgi:hypothetical protein
LENKAGARSAARISPIALSNARRKSMSTQILILGRLLRPGMRFQHASRTVRSPNGTVRPHLCTVTAVRRGLVSYRDEAGRLDHGYPSSFVTVVARWLEEAA